MMDLDSENNLNKFPLKGFHEFVERCKARGVRDVFLTGTNTDPLLYEYCQNLSYKLNEELPGCRFGIRTNGASENRYFKLRCFDMGSITVCSFDNDIYKLMMGQGEPPDLNYFAAFCDEAGWKEPPKVNVVLGPENKHEIFKTLAKCWSCGIKRVNLREPYGQPTVGNPMTTVESNRIDNTYGMPTYEYMGMHVTYWDVHYCEVESVNLYANGTVSEDYPITRGHSVNGKVLDQSNFTHGRHNEQWVTLRKKS